MGVFGKEKEYMDYTLLRKKGLLKMKEEQFKKEAQGADGFIDMTSKKGDDSTPTPNNFGFLSDMASASSPSGNQGSPVPNPLAGFDSVAPITPSSGLSGEMDSRELNALKIKMDDLNYKIDRFLERIDKIEEKLSKEDGQGSY